MPLSIAACGCCLPFTPVFHWLHVAGWHLVQHPADPLHTGHRQDLVTGLQHSHLQEHPEGCCAVVSASACWLGFRVTPRCPFSCTPPPPSMYHSLHENLHPWHEQRLQPGAIQSLVPAGCMYGGMYCSNLGGQQPLRCCLKNIHDKLYWFGILLRPPAVTVAIVTCLQRFWHAYCYKCEVVKD